MELTPLALVHKIRLLIISARMTLNCIKWWGSSSEDLKSVEYSFNAITSKSTLPSCGSIYLGYIF